MNDGVVRKVKSRYVFSITVIILIGVYSVVFSIAGYLQYVSFSYQDMDLAAISQAFWNGVHGRFFPTRHAGESTLFKNHRWLIALPLLPIYALFPSAVTLLVLQSFAVAVGAGAVYLLARRLLDPPLGLLFAFCYLIYPAVNYLTLYEFHPVAFALPLLLFTFYFYEQRVWSLYLMFLLLSLSCREDVALPIFGLGVYALLRGVKERDTVARGRWKWGISAILLSLSWFAVCVMIFPLLITRHLPKADQPDIIPLFFGWLGRSPTEIVGTVITRPWYVMKGVLTGPKLIYLFQLLVPLGFLSLLSPRSCLMILFAAAEGLLSSRSKHFSIPYQYTALITPFIFISAIMGTRNLLRRLRFGIRADYLILFLLVFAPLCAAWFGPLSHPPSPIRVWRVTEEDAVRRRLVALVPKESPVLATFGLASHLSDRPLLFYSFQFCGGWRPTGPDRIDVPLVQRTARFALIDFNDPLTFYYFFGPDGDRYLRGFLEDGWQLEETVNSLALFRKGDAPGIGLVEQSDLTEVDTPFSQPIKNAPGLVFRGYTLQPDRRLGFPVIETAVFLQCDDTIGENYLLGISFRHQGASGFSFGQYLFAPFRILPTSRWEKGNIIRQRCAILVPTNAPGGAYELTLSLVRPIGPVEFAGEEIYTTRNALMLP